MMNVRSSPGGPGLTPGCPNVPPNEPDARRCCREITRLNSVSFEILYPVSHGQHARRLALRRRGGGTVGSWYGMH